MAQYSRKLRQIPHLGKSFAVSGNMNETLVTVFETAANFYFTINTTSIILVTIPKNRWYHQTATPIVRQNRRVVGSVNFCSTRILWL